MLERSKKTENPRKLQMQSPPQPAPQKLPAFRCITSTYVRAAPSHYHRQNAIVRLTGSMQTVYLKRPKCRRRVALRRKRLVQVQLSESLHNLKRAMTTLPYALVFKRNNGPPQRQAKIRSHPHPGRSQCTPGFPHGPQPLQTMAGYLYGGIILGNLPWIQLDDWTHPS